MQLAVEAFAQGQKGHSVQMKVVAASWAFAKSEQKSDDDQSNKPDDK